MKLVEKHINFQNEVVVLTNYRAMYWPKEQALIASDLHIGKSAHFRKHGIPISVNVQHNDLDRLSVLLEHYKPKTFIVVGDLFNAEVNSYMDLFKNWRMKYEHLDIILIKGNHDRLKAAYYNLFNIECCQKQLEIGPFTFIHEPIDKKDLVCISGHIHPGVVLKTRVRPRIKLPCYSVSESQIILPAFSKFSGLNIAKSQHEVVHYAFTDTSFFEF